MFRQQNRRKHPETIVISDRKQYVTMTEKRLDLFKFWIHERPPDPDSMIESRG